jgi:hypothetical protein
MDLINCVLTYRLATGARPPTRDPSGVGSARAHVSLDELQMDNPPAASTHNKFEDHYVMWHASPITSFGGRSTIIEDYS